jgi:hypothetical protein
VPGKAAAAALYAALTLVLAYPLSLHPASSALPGDPDTDLFMWTLAWGTHAVVARPLSIFDANIYYPEPNTLAYSENLLGSVPFAAPVLWLTGNPVLGLNVVTLLSVVLCGLGAYVLARRLGMGTAAALLCGLVFAFSPARFFRIGQLHLTTVQWVPFGLASLHAYLNDGRSRDLKLAVFFLTLQALTSGHGAVFAVVAMAGLVAFRILTGDPLAPLRRMRDLGVAGASLLLPAVMVYLPYQRVQEVVGLRRSLDDWPPTPESFIASPAAVYGWLLSVLGEPDAFADASGYLFPGILPILLAAVLLWRRAPVTGVEPGIDRVAAPARSSHARQHGTWWTRAATLASLAALGGLAVVAAMAVTEQIRLELGDTLVLSIRNSRRAWLVVAVALAVRLALLRRVPFEISARLRGWTSAREKARRESWRRPAVSRRHEQWAIPFYALLTLVAVLLSIGPPLGIWPYVHDLPVLSFIRVPWRFMILATLSLAVLAGFGFERLSAGRAPARRRALALVVGALMIGEFASIPLPTRPYAVEIPAVNRWLDGQPKPFVVAEMPVTGAERMQSTFMLHSMAHWQKTVHGHSGVRVRRHVELYDQLRSFPDEASLEALERFKVDYVVVHRQYYQPDRWEQTDARLREYADRLTLEHEEDGGRVYSIRLK